jgi:probable HAF family extracellular repeat protein
MHDLGTLPGGYYSQGIGINVAGEVVGYSNAGDGGTYGFSWTSSTGMVELPSLPGEPNAGANAINDFGEVVGGSGSDVVLWHNDKAHSAESLGTLPGAGWGTAFSINDVDQVVGWSGFTAFLWTRERGMQDLNTLIPANSGWSLSLARSINLRGQITGQGTIGGQQHGFLLTPVSD